jgi:hypothetical protein
MKRTVALALLGMGTATAAFAQGHLSVGNYVSPYNSQIMWDAGTTTLSGAVTSNAGLQFQIYYGAGVVSDPGTLTAGEVTTIDDTKGYNGGGWYFSTIQDLPGWTAGDTYTFQLRTLDGTTPGGPVDMNRSVSQMWTESAAITPIANPANLGTGGLGLTVFAVVPEPSTFALAGLGAAALLIFRRRA